MVTDTQRIGDDGEHGFTVALGGKKLASNDTSPLPVKVFVVCSLGARISQSWRKVVQFGPTSTVELREDVLEGLDYTPENPWTASFLVSIEHSDLDIREGLLLDRQQSLSFPVGRSLEEENSETGRLSWVQVLTEYFAHGLWHIFTGYDHMLFMGPLAPAACSVMQKAGLGLNFDPDESP